MKVTIKLWSTIREVSNVRVSINITEETRTMIKEIKNEEFCGQRVTDGYIINMVMSNVPIENIEKKLSDIRQGKNYQSIKYTLDRQANERINDINKRKCVSKDIIINSGLKLYNEELEKKKKFKMYKRRYQLIMKNELGIKIVDNSGNTKNLTELLPGIYSIWVSAKGKEKITLYVGKSKLISSRETSHLNSFIDTPEYFGFTDDDLQNNKLELGLTVEHLIDLTKIETFQELVSSLQNKERWYIEQLKPCTQKNMNMKKAHEKRAAVKKMIESLLS